MNKTTFLSTFLILVIMACGEDEPMTSGNESPRVKSESSYTVLMDEEITYAFGLAYDGGTTIVLPQKLDIYYPDNTSTNRPVYMFIHGGGFQGGTKTKPEIIDMANYFASRGWVFASIDYRTTEELEGTDFTGFAPQEWIDFTTQNASTPDEARTSIAMYTAQRDAKAAVRWIVANASSYNINTDFITVGGASAGAITTIALGMSDQEDFANEIPVADDPSLSTTNLNENYKVKSMIYFWGSNVKLELYETIYGVNKYDSNDPELFMAHGTMDINPSTPFSEATELDGIYNSLGVYRELVPLEGAGHGAWNATANGKNLSEMTFDFLIERQNLNVE